MKKLIPVLLAIVFVLLATKAISIPGTPIDDAIARAFTPLGGWFSNSPGMQNAADGITTTFTPIFDGLGEALSGIGSIPGKAVSAASGLPDAAQSAGKNAANSLLPFFSHFNKDVDPAIQTAAGEPTHSPLPLLALAGLSLAIIRAEKKRLLMILLLFTASFSFIYYM